MTNIGGASDFFLKYTKNLAYAHDAKSGQRGEEALTKINKALPTNAVRNLLDVVAKDMQVNHFSNKTKNDSRTSCTRPPW